jgi:hypothetical protein
MLVLDSGGVSRLAERSRRAAALLVALRGEGLWPAAVPSVVVVESVAGHAGHDARTNRLLKACDILEELPESLARRAAGLRARAGRGSAVDAVVVATADPGGTVLTSDIGDLGALAKYATDVSIEQA